MFTESCHWTFVCLPSNSASNQTRKNDVTIIFIMTGTTWTTRMIIFDKLSIFLYIYIDPSRCKKWDEALIFESRLFKFRSLKWFFFPFFHPSIFGLFLGMTALSLHFSGWIPGLLFLKMNPTDFWVIFSGLVKCIHKNTPKNTCPNHICNCSYMQPETSCRIFCGSLILRILQTWGPSFAFGEVCGKTLLQIGIFLCNFRAAFLRTWIILLGRSPQVYTKLRKFLGSFAVKRHSPKDGHFGGDDSSLFLEPPLKKSPEIYLSFL